MCARRSQSHSKRSSSSASSLSRRGAAGPPPAFTSLPKPLAGLDRYDIPHAFFEVHALAKSQPCIYAWHMRILPACFHACIIPGQAPLVPSRSTMNQSHGYKRARTFSSSFYNKGWARMQIGKTELHRQTWSRSMQKHAGTGEDRSHIIFCILLRRQPRHASARRELHYVFFSGCFLACNNSRNRARTVS